MPPKGCDFFVSRLFNQHSDPSAGAVIIPANESEPVRVMHGNGLGELMLCSPEIDKLADDHCAGTGQRHPCFIGNAARKDIRKLLIGWSFWAVFTFRTLNIRCVILISAV